MITMVADETALLEELRFFVEPVEVYDTKGKLLGLFVPANLERGKQLYAQAAARIDRAEIERRIQSKEKGVPFEEVLGRLKMLEAELERRKATGEKEFTTDEALAYFRSLRAAAAQGSYSGGADVRTETDQCATP